MPTNRRWFSATIFYFLSLGILSWPSGLRSEVWIWDGGSTTDGNIGSIGNWTATGVPVASDSLNFTGALRTTVTNNLLSGTQFGGLTFDQSAASFALTGSAFSLGGNIEVTSVNTQSIANPISLNATQTISLPTLRNQLYITGIISGAGFGFTQSGAGLLTLSTATNTYSGPTVVNGGTLSIDSDARLGAVPATMTAGNVVLNGGALRVTVSNVTINANRGIALGDGTLLSGGGINTGGFSTLNYGGVLSNNGAANSLTKTGSGTLALFGTSSYTGDTIVDQDRLTLNFNAGTSTSILHPSSRLVMGGWSSAFGGNVANATSNYPGFVVAGKASAARSQTVNGLLLNQGLSLIQAVTNNVNAASKTALTLGAITHTPGGTVQFTFASGTSNPNPEATAGVATNGLATTSINTNGILGGWATYLANTGTSASGHNSGTNWASIDANGSIVAYSAYTDIANNGTIANSSTSNVRIATTGGTTAGLGSTGGTPTTINTLLISGSTAQTITIGSGNTLRLGSYGGIWNTGTTNVATTLGSSVALGGKLTAGGADNTPGEIVFNSNSGSNTTTVFTVNSSITNNGSGAVSVTKIGNNSMTLAAANTYTGGTYLVQGRIIASNAAAFGTGLVTIQSGAFTYLNAGSSAIYANDMAVAGYGGENANLGAIRFNNGETLGKADLSSTLTLYGNARIGGGNGTVNSRITGDYGLDITANGGITVTLKNPSNNFGGHFSINGANHNNATVVKLGAANVLPDGAGKGNIIINGGSSSAINTLDLNGFNETINGLASATNGLRTKVINNSSANSAVTLTLGNGNATSQFDGVLADGSATKTLALIKIGTGTQVLTGVSTNTGATLISAGTLMLSGTGSINGTSAVTINGSTARLIQASSASLTKTVTLTQGTLDGIGTLSAVNVSNSTNAILTAGSGATTGTATLTIGALSFAGAAIVNLSPQTKIATTTLSTAATPITINASGVWADNTVYPMLTYTALTGSGFGSFVKGNITGLSPRQVASLTNPTGSVALSISGDSPRWTGLASSSWTAATLADPKNWELLINTTPVDFLSGDIVLFDDSATGSTTLDIDDANVNTTSVTFNNSNLDYTLASANGFGIASGSLVKNGTGKLTIQSTNSSSGMTIINAGIVNYQSGASLGANSAIVAANNTTVQLQGTIAGGSQPLTISGAGALGQSGALVNVSGDNSYAGNLAIGAATTLASDSGTLTLLGNINSTGVALTATGAGNLRLAGIIPAGAGALIKNGSGVLTLAGNNVFTSGITVNDGVLQFTSNTHLGANTNPVLINGATLHIGDITGTLTQTHPITIGALGVTFNITGASNPQFLFGTVNTLLGNGPLLVTGGVSGGNLRLTQTQSFTGDVTLEGTASLEYGVANALPAATTITLNNGGDLACIGNLATPLVIPHSVNVATGGGTLSFANGTNGTFSGNIAANAPLTIALRDWYNKGNVRSGSITGTISGTGGVAVNSGNGSGGVLSLAGANTYSGPTTITSSIVSLSNLADGGQTSSIGSSSSDVANLIFSNGTLRYNGPTIGIDRGFSIVAAKNATFDVTSVTTVLAIDGDSPASTGSLTKLGLGGLTFTGTHLYTGTTTINAGLLTSAGDISHTSSTVINNASTLSVTGGTYGGTSGDIQISTTSTSTGSLTLSDGIVNANRVILGGNSSNNGTPGSATVLQTGGVLNCGRWFSIGSGASTASTTASGSYSIAGGQLNVNASGGARLEVANFSGATGSMTISGNAEVRLFNNASIALGSNNNAGNGTVTQNGGSVTFYSNLGTTEGGSGVLMLGTANTLGAKTYTYSLNGGTLTVPQIQRNTTSTAATSIAIFNFNGGTLVATKANTTFMQSLNAANVGTGGAIIDSNGFAITIAQSLLGSAGDGGVKKKGAGSLTLASSNTFRGAVTVEEGTLVLPAENIHTDGTVVRPGGTLTIANATGSATGTGAVVVDEGGTMLANIANTGKIVKATSLTFNGTVNGTTGGTMTISTDGVIGIGPHGLVAGTGSITGKSNITMAGVISGAVNLSTTAGSFTMTGELNGTGTFGSTLGMQVSGTLNPGGTGIGTLRINGPMTMTPSALLTLQIGGIGAADKLANVKNFTLDGTVDVALGSTVNTALFEGDESWDLIDWTGTYNSSGFALATDLILPDISANDYEWDRSEFLTLGKIKLHAIGRAAGRLTRANMITQDGATFNGNVFEQGDEAPTVTIYYGTVDAGQTSAGWQNSIIVTGGAVAEGSSFSQAITGLARGTRYYYRASFTNSAGTRWNPKLWTFVTQGDVLVPDFDFENHVDKNNQPLIATGQVATSLLPWVSTGTASISAIGISGSPHASLSTNYQVEVFQDLAEIYESDMEYSLIVAVGRRSATSSGNISEWRLGDASGAIYGLDTKNAINLPADTFVDQPALVVDTVANPDAVGQPIRISFKGLGAGASIFDSVRLMKTASTQHGRALGNSVAPTNVGPTFATAKANVTSIGSNQPNVTFYFGETDQGTNKNAWDNSLTVPGTLPVGPVSYALGGLYPQTHYFYRVLFANASGETWGGQAQSFTTDVFDTSVFTRPATLVSVTRATTNAIVGGSGLPLAVTIYYGTTDGADVAANWDHSINMGSVGNPSKAGEKEITGLLASTQYFYRAYATTSDVTATAPAMWATNTETFTTLSTIPPTANDLVITGIKNDLMTSQVSGTEVDLLPLTFAKISDPVHGTLTFDEATGRFRYLPDVEFLGEDSFTFKCLQDSLESTVGTVHILIRNNIPEWTWMGGANVAKAKGIYGTLGVTSTNSMPGARSDSASWVDASGNLWLFGGTGFGSNTGPGALNDLWKRSADSGQWTWMGGSDAINAAGIYGTMGTPAVSNQPGARASAVAWTGPNGLFYLFGGVGRDSSLKDTGTLNDLWVYDPSLGEWTWLKGSNTIKANGNYGPTLGDGTALTTPSARANAVVWQVSDGVTWLFGGKGLSSTGNAVGNLNDLWKYEAASNQWTWMKGSDKTDAMGSYGTLYTFAAANTPGARAYACAWTGSDGGLWLFGGNGKASTAALGNLNDLWKFDTTSNEWAWMGGSKLTNAVGNYGTLGAASLTNQPSARAGALTWTSADGSLMLFGGQGSAAFNDVWKYDPFVGIWTWIKGPSAANGTGIYGQLAVPSPSNTPGSRRNVAAGWRDAANDVWLLGGLNGANTFNDIWRLDLPPVPRVSTLAASSIDDAHATLNASATSESAELGLYFVWSKNRNFSNASASDVQTLGSPISLSSMMLSDLEEGTSYYYRAEATNGFSIGRGEVLSFTTSGIQQSPAVNFATTAITVPESVGVVSLVVQLGAAAPSAFSVPVTIATGSSATAASDFTVPPVTLNFVTGQTFATLSVPIIDDSEVDGGSTNHNESFTVVLGTPGGGIALGGAKQCRITITDNDVAPIIVIDPIAHFAALGSSTSFHVVLNANASLPLTIQWMKDDVPIKGATGTTFSIVSAKASDAGRYSVTVSNAVGSDVSTYAELNLVTLSNSVRTLAAGTTQATSLSVAGVSTGFSPLLYQWRKHQPDPAPPDDLLDASPHIVGVETAALTLTGLTAADSGVYSCRVYKSGKGEIISGLFTLNIVGAKPEILPITALPTGVVGALYSQAIEITSDPAKAATGFVITGLPAGLKYDKLTGFISGTPTKAITNANVKIIASNIAGPSAQEEATLTILDVPPDILGSYNALLPRDPLVNGNRGARFEVTPTKTGSYTAKLYLAASAISSKGNLLASVGAGDIVTSSGTAYFVRKGLPTLRVDFGFGPAANALTATLVDPSTGGSATGTGYRQTWDAKLNKAANYKGDYTFGLEIDESHFGDLDLPQGNGYGAFSIADAGTLTLAGRTADGLVYTSATTLSASGEVILFAPFNPVLGSLIGQSQITLDAPSNHVNNTFTGSWTWSKNAATSATKDRPYRAGFQPVEVSAVGGKYQTPGAGQVIMGVAQPTSLTEANFQLSFSEGGLFVGDLDDFGFNISSPQPSKLVVTIAKFDAKALINPNPASIAFALNAKPSGQFSGSFILPDAIKTLSRTTSYYGSIVRQGSSYSASGFFLLPQRPEPGQTVTNSPLLSGLVELQPASPVP